MVIFHSYVSLPEGNDDFWPNDEIDELWLVARYSRSLRAPGPQHSKLLITSYPKEKAEVSGGQKLQVRPGDGALVLSDTTMWESRSKGPGFWIVHHI